MLPPHPESCTNAPSTGCSPWDEVTRPTTAIGACHSPSGALLLPREETIRGSTAPGPNVDPFLPKAMSVSPVERMGEGREGTSSASQNEVLTRRMVSTRKPTRRPIRCVDC